MQDPQAAVKCWCGCRHQRRTQSPTHQHPEDVDTSARPHLAAVLKGKAPHAFLCVVLVPPVLPVGVHPSHHLRQAGRREGDAGEGFKKTSGGRGDDSMRVSTQKDWS